MASQVKIVVMVSGKISSGKDTIADYLISQYEFCKIGFADRLKDTTAHLFDVNVGNHVGVTVSKRDRSILQKTGSFGRAIDQNIWVNLLKKDLDETDSDRIVIKDTRYPNEVESIKEYCLERDITFVAIRINHYPKKINHCLLKTLLSMTGISAPFLGQGFHKSEIALDAYDEWDLEFDRESETTHNETFNAVERVLKGKMNVR